MEREVPNEFTLDQILFLITKIIYILNNHCNSCLSNFSSGEIHPKSCLNTCSYTSTGIATIFTLIEQNPELKTYIMNEPDIVKLPFILNVLHTIPPDLDTISDINYMGIVNTIGLIWDVHDFPIESFPDEKYRQYKPTGIYYALKEKLTDWFIESDYPQLQPGVNIISFYLGHIGDDPITLHHSFVYVWNDVCILVDSWNGRSIPKVTNEISINISKSPLEIRKIITKQLQQPSHNNYNIVPVGEILNRPSSIRLYSLDIFQKKLNIINEPPTPINRSEKINIMKSTFDGYKDDNYNNNYTNFKVCILKKEKLDEFIREGFNANRYLYGGHKKKRRKSYCNKTKKCRKNSYFK